MLRLAITAVIMLAVAIIAYSFGMNLLYAYVLADPTPVQPIAFSHKIHAGDNDVPCRYCHMYAVKSRVSGVPSVQKCMGCHQSVRPDSPEIKKIYRYWEKQQPIPWQKVYDLPDYIYFPHNRHVKGGVRCQECHGDVASMQRITKIVPLVMGWCLNCHKERNGPTDCWECHA